MEEEQLTDETIKEMARKVGLFIKTLQDTAPINGANATKLASDWMKLALAKEGEKGGGTNQS
jgi:hypothetical protein